AWASPNTCSTGSKQRPGPSAAGACAWTPTAAWQRPRPCTCATGTAKSSATTTIPTPSTGSRRGSTPEPAQFGQGLVTGEGFAGRAGRAFRIGRQPCFPEAHAERIEMQQPPGQRLADAEDQLDRLGGLQQADHARQHAEHAGLGAVGRV